MNHNTYKMHIYLLIRLNIIPFENQWKIHTMKCHTMNTNPTNTFKNRKKCYIASIDIKNCKSYFPYNSILSLYVFLNSTTCSLPK